MKIVYIAGQGGHLAQFERFKKLAVHGKNDILLTDIKRKDFVGLDVIECGELRPKTGFNLAGAIKYAFNLLFIIYPKIIRQGDVVISFGPGIAILPAFLFKITNKKVIHIETWSRFETKSLTGRFMYKLADKFYIQNEGLLNIYPKSIYSGRL
jgi:UDP-N-acetylglucosamine:LPS N-acetylglucosamine transferase